MTMAKVTEIVFPEDAAMQNGMPLHNSCPDQQPPASGTLVGWFEGYGDLLTVDDLAEILHVSRKSAQTRCNRGDLPAVLIGRRWYVPKARLVEFLLSECANGRI